MTATTEIVSPQLESITEFIEEQGLKLHPLLIHENPYRPKDAQQGLVHWSCKLYNDKKHVIIYFSKGINIRRWCPPPETGLSDTIPIHVPYEKIDMPYDGPLPPFDNEEERRTYNLCSAVEPPLLPEILDILAKDFWLVDRTGTFPRWCEALGTTSDSFVARSAYEVVVQQRTEMVALLGDEPFYHLVYEMERMNPWKFAEKESEEPENNS